MVARAKEDEIVRDALDDLIDRYFELLPDIRRLHGSTWALIADGALVGAFPDFSSAADHMAEHFEGRQVLIRHTDEKPVFVPYVHLSA